ncbi:complement component C6 [Rhinophrynus dorsalis]
MGCIPYVVFLLIISFAGKASSCFCEHYPWASWSSCSKTCESGTQSRSRNINYNDGYYWKHDCDRLCTKYESRSCNEQGCPINCRLGDFGAWSDCDPCLKKQFRTRSLERPSQFGGQSCSGQLVESRECIPSNICNIEELDCNKKFKCDTGRCIASTLKCNGDNDCGDNSDERNCRKKPEPTRSFEIIPGAQLMGNGYNFLSGESRGEVLGNSFFGGKRTTVSGNGTGPNRKLYRLPANIEKFKFELKDEVNDVASDFYSSPADFNRENSRQASGTSAGGSFIGIPVFFNRKQNTRHTSSSSFKEVLKATSKKSSNFIRINKVISVSDFTVKKNDLWLSDSFRKALNHLPLEYNYALYSRIFDNFGTHYITSGSMGGSYDLLYQYSSEDMKTSGLTEAESTECLRVETSYRIFFFKIRKVSERCVKNKLSERYEGSFLQSSEKSTSLTKGGRAEYTAKLTWQRDGGKSPENNAYRDWVASTMDNPVIIDFELSPILDLIKDIPCAVTKRRNLMKAFATYTEKFDPCLCSPCPNNAQVVLSGTECLCVCQAGTYGDHCEKRAPDYKSVAVDGAWSCWSSWSDCDASLTRRRTRVCNNPSPRNGGKPCKGEQAQEGHCYISLFEDKGALCINDDEEKKDIDRERPVHDTGCPKPDPPENGYFPNEKHWYSVAEEIEIVCVEGYELSGYQFLRCLPDGTWKQEEAECIRSSCPRPAASEDVTIFRFKTEYKVGETIEISCPSGFIVTGQKRYTCERDLTWNPPILTPLSCEKEREDLQGNCDPGQKQVGSECVCMSPETDCGHYTEELCIFDANLDNSVTMSSCQYLAEKCLGIKQLHFVENGPCTNVNLDWVRSRISLSAKSKKKEPCGYDFCYDWEKCSGSQCYCLLPYQCPEDNTQQYCLKIGTAGRQKTFNHCSLGAIKCSKVKSEFLHDGACTQ